MLYIALSVFNLSRMRPFILAGVLVCCVLPGVCLAGIIKVFRWYIPASGSYATVAEGEYPDSILIGKGWVNKTFLFYEYNQPAPHTVAVNSWINADGRHISICEDEYTDNQMKNEGYRKQHVQFYAATRRDSNAVAVFRWLLPKTHSWITIPDNEQTQSYIEKGYRHKTFQYFAVTKGF